MKKPTPKKAALRKSKAAQRDQTDWKRIDAMKDEDIDFSDTQEVTPEMLARGGILRRNLKVVPRKMQLILVVDSDLLWWYMKQGPGYETLMTSVLRAYMEEHSARDDDKR